MKMVTEAPITEAQIWRWAGCPSAIGWIELNTWWDTPLIKMNTSQADLATHKSQRIEVTFHMNSLWLFYIRLQTLPRSSLVVETGTMEKPQQREGTGAQCKRMVHFEKLPGHTQNSSTLPTQTILQGNLTLRVHWVLGLWRPDIHSLLHEELKIKIKNPQDIYPG